MWPRRRHDPRIRDEIQFHRDRLIDDYVAGGMDRKDAERRAFLEFGNVAQIEEVVRDVRGRWLSDLTPVFRYALRMLRRSPAFASAAILSLALGIGANVAIFTLINAVILRTLPVPDPARLVQSRGSRKPAGRDGVRARYFEYFRDSCNRGGPRATAAAVPDGEPDAGRHRRGSGPAGGRVVQRTARDPLRERQHGRPVRRAGLAGAGVHGSGVARGVRRCRSGDGAARDARAVQSRPKGSAGSESRPPLDGTRRGSTRDLDDPDRSMVRERILATLGGLFGALALVVAAVGMFGVLAFQVTRRTNEFGVRMALGATPRRITGLVVRDVALMLVLGVAIGSAAALTLTGFARRILFGLTPTDPGVFAVAALVLASVGMLAGWLPARRAAHLDPLVSLRHE